MSHPATQHPSQVASHLEPEVWAKVNRLLVRKAISEYAHEWLLEPERLGPSDRPGFDRYRLTLAEGAEYRFDAQIMAMRHWRIPPESITKTVAGAPAPLDALQFVIEVRDRLALPADRLPIYLTRSPARCTAAPTSMAAPLPTPPSWRWPTTRPSRPR